MKNIKKRICIILALLCMFGGTALTQAPSFVQEQEATDVPAQEQPSAEEQTAGTKLFLFREDRTLTMPKSTVSYWFVVPQGISVGQSAVLTLHISYSATLIEALSSVTVFINGTPVGTRRIVEQAGDEFIWTVEFDSSLIRMTGYNELKITTVHRSLEGDCADVDNPSNWVVVHSDSFLSLEESAAVDPLLSSYFALYYDTFAEPFTIAGDYVLSDTSDADIISAMLGLSNASGMYYSDKEYVRLNVYDRDGFSVDNKNKIFIESQEAPGEWSEDLLPLPRQAPAQDGAYISIAGFTEEYPFYKLFVSGSGRSGLKKATAFLSNRLLVEQAESGDVLLNSDIPVDNVQSSVALNEDGVYSFADYGYADITMAGAFHQSAYLSFAQPGGVSGGEGSYLELRFRHSAVLLSDRSVLNVYVNNVAVSSVKLSPGNTETGSLIVELSASALTQPVINVTIETYHHLGQEVDCIKDYYDVAWTVIDAENSRIVFEKSENALRLSLKNFPYFSSGNTSTVSVYVPGSAGKDALEAVAALAIRAGQNTRMAFEWEIVPSASGLSSVAGDIVIIAEKSDAALPEEIAEKLAITSSGTGYVVRDATLPVIPETLAGKTIIQVIRSPWNFYSSIYVIIYDGAEGLANLERFLGERTELNQLDGQLCVVGGETGIQTFTVSPASDGEDSVPVDRLDHLIAQAEEFTGLPAWLIFSLLAVVAVLIAIVIVIAVKTRKRDEYQDAAEEHRKKQDFFRDE